MSKPSQDTARIAEAPARTIVVAEDDPDLRELIAMALRKRGFGAVRALDGRLAFVEIEQRRRDGRPVALLITDLQMPQLGGLKLIDALRRTSNRIPFIVISSFLSRERRAELEGLGAAAVFSKPFDLQLLLAEVERLVQG